MRGVYAILNTTEAESSMLLAQPFDTTKSTWGVADERKWEPWQRLRKLSCSLISLRIDVEVILLLRCIGQGTHSEAWSICSSECLSREQVGAGWSRYVVDIEIWDIHLYD